MSRRTPLYDVHRGLGARMVDFAGWEMPVTYSGATEEHAAVRTACGLFDVSHMGEIELSGSEARATCQRLTVNDVDRLEVGACQYSMFCNDNGGVLDDLIVSRLDADRYLLVVNAANTPADVAWVRQHAGAKVQVADVSEEMVLFALQGPSAAVALQSLTSLALAAQRPFTVRAGKVAGIATLVARTGYTGEDGFEIFASATAAPPLWAALLAAARAVGGLPVGLAARDTLRLEAGLPLCGSDMDATTTPLEAGLGWVVKLTKPEFIGRAALKAQQEAGVPKRLVGVELAEAGIPRHGYPVWWNGKQVGGVTSGTKSPTLGTFIGLAYVTAEAARLGTEVTVEIRGRRVPARVVERRFYRRSRREG